MQNGVAAGGASGGVADTLVRRSLSRRHAVYASEVDRFISAGLRVMQRRQTLNPRVSEIIKDSGLSNQAFYRHFRSKDELLVAILDDGVRQLVGYLEHLMSKEERAVPRIQRWVEGVLAQAVDPVAADATRLFVVDSLRLATQFPDDSTRSAEALREPLRKALADAVDRGELDHAEPDRDAEAIYHLTMGTMHGYLVRGEAPTRAEVARTVRFAIGGLDGAARSGGAARGA